MRDLSSYAFAPLRDGELTLYRGSGTGVPPILLVAAQNGSPGCLTRLEHEYALRSNLDSAWAVQPIELSRHRNRLALVLQDPGGAVLDRLLGRPLGITEFLRIAISLAGALRQAHARGLIHKDNSVAAIWVWDINRILAKNYTDNVVDLVVQKLKRLPLTTQDALKHLACLGNMAEIGRLALIQNDTEEAMHRRLCEAVQAGLVIHQGDGYQFLHDRIQQAAYSLFPEEQRPAVHLRIGRMLLANTAAVALSEQLFEVANHFNRGRTLIVDRDEKAQVATINLRAGRKAKASAAYASARAYLASGMALIGGDDYRRRD